MASKDLLYSKEARAAIQSGVNKLADAVRVTLGARGKYVVLDRDIGLPIVTNDGVTIAREINLEDAFENIGAQLIKEVATKTNESAGDGTTSSVLLVQKLINLGMQHIAAGYNPTILVREIKSAKDIVIKKLTDMSKPLDTDDEIKQIATISSGDDEIGNLILQAIQKVGRTGVVTIDESQTGNTYLEQMEGMQFERGLLSPFFINNPERIQAEYNDVKVVIVDEHISIMDNTTMLPLLAELYRLHSPVLLIAQECDGHALQSLIVNQLKEVMKIAVVKAPGYGERRAAMLDDIAVLTGATVISKERGVKLSEATLNNVGFARRIVSTKDTTTIVADAPDMTKLEERKAMLKGQFESTDNNYDKEWYEKRLAKLSGGIAVIYVGAHTDADLKAKKFKVEDALNATKSAIDKGIVPGGGYALLDAANDLPDTVGGHIVRDVCRSPLWQISTNAGEVGDVVVINCLSKKQGYNAETGEYGDMIKMGIIDPTKVCINALENAVSSASLLLNTEALVISTPKKDVK